METQVVQYHSWRWVTMVECGWITMYVRQNGWAVMLKG